MSVKHHCLICGDLIFSGMYCSDCSREIIRTRTTDDEPLEDWITRVRFLAVRVILPISSGASLYEFERERANGAY